MAPSFSKNAILKGYVDYFCLICESYFRNDDETVAHISKESHQKRLKSTTYVEEFKDDYIKKINSKYFCELCNKLLPVLAKVRIHITEPLHLDMKKAYMFKRKDNNVMVFDKVVINEHSWHGLFENSCAVCNLEYDDENEHKKESSHIIKLIQFRVEFDRDNNLYRKIDETTFQCLTCNVVASLNNLMVHFDKTEHKNKYKECCEAFQLLDTASDKSSKEKSYIESTEKAKEKEITQSNSEINNETSEISKGKNTKQMDELKTKSSTTGDRNKTDLKYVFDEKCEAEICEVLNATDYITFDENENTWCILCNWVMSVSSVARHLSGKHHQTILKLHRKRIDQYKNINKSIRTRNINNETVKDNSMLLNSIDKFQKNGITLNFESKLATCKKCSITLEYNCDAIDNHIKEHSKVSRKPSKAIPFPSGKVPVSGENKNMLFTSPVHTKQHNNANKLNTKHEEIIDDSENEEISNSVPAMMTKGVQIGKNPKRTILQKVPLNDFVKTAVGVDCDIFKDIIINNKFVINLFTLAGLITENEVIRCYMCDKNLMVNDLVKHVMSFTHEKKTNEIFVITEMDSEFIRELMPDKFHCGYCNIVETPWEEMQLHVKTSSHKEAKHSAECRLIQYKAEIANGEYQKFEFEKLKFELFASRFS